MAGRAVAMVSPNFHPYVGGAEKQALELSKRLLRSGTAVEVLTRRVKGLPWKDAVEGVPVRRLPAGGPGLLDPVLFMLSVFFWLVSRPLRWSAIHVHLAGSPALAAAAAGLLLRLPVVVKLGGGRGVGEIAVSRNTLSGRLKLLLLRMLRPRLAVVTQDIVADLEAAGMGGMPISVIPNGVDTEVYKPAAPGEKSALRFALGWKPGLVLLFVGRLDPVKRLVGFMESFAEALKETGADASFVLAGAGPEEAALRKAAARLGERVLFVGETSEVARLCAAADVFVLPSVSEGLSNALLEAMSSGLAVLASRVGGTKEAVGEERAGLLFDPLDPQERRKQLLRYLREPALAARFGRQAREDASQRYALERVAEEYRKLYGVRH